MSSTPIRLLGGLVVAGGLSLALAAPAAAQTCVVDPYSGQVQPGCGGGGTGGDGGTGTGGGGGGASTGARGELPFTGGEVLLVSLVGAATLAGGATLVVAARRRTPAAA